MKFFDPSLYLLTDESFFKKRTLLESVHQAVLGGITLVQLRDKEATPQAICEKARALLKLLRPYKIPLIINDHVELVKEVGAEGVHLGNQDLAPNKAREILGAQSIVGYSVEVHQNFQSLPLDSLDYVAASSVYPTENKKMLPNLSLKRNFRR